MNIFKSVIKNDTLNDVEERLKNKDFIGAIELINSIAPSNFDEKYYFLKARTYFSLKKYDLALESFKKIESADFKDNKYYFLQGQIFEKKKIFKDAEIGYFIAVRKQPKNKRFIKKYIDFIKGNQFYHEGIAKIEKIANLKLDKDFLLRLEIVKYYIEVNELKKAFLLLGELSLRVDANLEDINILYSKIYSKIGDYRSALDKINLVNDTSPDFLLLKSDLYYLVNKSRLPLVENFYNLELIKKNEDLTIVFSPLPGKYILKGYEFNTSVLYVSEVFMSYFTFEFENLVKHIESIIKSNNFKNVNLTGSSKGSFAAINLALRLEQKIKNALRVIAFSPQSQIYPINKDISKLPSYKDLIAKSTEYLTLKQDFEKYGNPLSRLSDSNIELFVIYGDQLQRDKIEAEKIGCFENVVMLPIENYSFHTSILLYVKKGDDLKKSLATKAAFYNKDDQYFLPENNDVLISDILKRVDEYSFDLNNMLLK